MSLKKLIELHGINHVNIRFNPNTPGIDNRSQLDCSLARVKDESSNIDYNKLILSNTSKKFSKTFSFDELEKLEKHIAYVISYKGRKAD